MKPKTSANRLEYLDWMRGIGAVIMLQGHVFHSYIRNDLRGSGPYVLSQFVGGMPPAIFLFLTGITLAFLMDSTERRGIPAPERFTASVRRAGYLFALAFAFRIQLWLFGLPAAWQDLFRVDILNCMGFSMLALSAMAVFRTTERARYCAVLGLGIALASPVISQMNWSGVPWMIRSYIIPDFASFGFFPWGAYLAFGMSAGSAIRLIPHEQIERAVQWAALLGAATLMGCQYFANQPYSIYSKADYWLNSPAQVLSKLSIVLLLLALAFVWTRYGAKPGWSWVRQFGTTSLLVYWVHIELVYGRASFLWKTNLSVAQTVVAALLMIGVMLGISTAKTYWHRVSAWLNEFGWSFGPKPDRVPGD